MEVGNNARSESDQRTRIAFGSFIYFLKDDYVLVLLNVYTCSHPFVIRHKEKVGSDSLP